MSQRVWAWCLCVCILKNVLQLQCTCPRFCFVWISVCFKIMVFRHLNQSQFQNHTEEILFSLKFFIEHSFTVFVFTLYGCAAALFHGFVVARFDGSTIRLYWFMVARFLCSWWHDSIVWCPTGLCIERFDFTVWHSLTVLCFTFHLNGFSISQLRVMQLHGCMV